MALPVDLRDIYKFGKEISKDRDEPVSLHLLIELDTPEELLEEAREAFRPRTASAFVDVEVVDSESPLVIAPATDAAVILAGSGTSRTSALVTSLREKRIPVCAVVLGGSRRDIDYRLGLPIEDVVLGQDPVSAMSALAGWLADKLNTKRLPLAMNFHFTRRAVGEEIVKTTALQNALIGSVTIIPGTDMPLMTANQAKMLLQLATAYGQRIGGDRLGELAAVVGGGFALRAVARQALTAIPGFGWAIKGGIGYSGTIAMGRAALAWFEEGADLSEIASRVKERFGRGSVPVEVTDVTGEDADSDAIQGRLALDGADGDN